MTKRQFYIMMGACFGLGFYQSKLNRRQKEQMKILKQMGQCFIDLKDYFEIQQKLETAEKFEEIVTEEFPNGLE